METIYGRLGKDPELKYTKDQEAICLFSIAINKNEEGLEELMERAKEFN